MEKESQRRANKGMHRFVSGRSFVMLVAPILLSMVVFNHLKKKKGSAKKESTEGASAPAFISLLPTGGGTHQYDIFLSFRGSDPHKGFTDHLYHSLVNAGIVPIFMFRDDDSIPICEKFGSQLLDVIARSKISIPIISENYASSKWCLRELIHIMDCKKSASHIVLPIFYEVDPADVRCQKGNFGEAFHMHKKHFDAKDIQEGQRALTEVSYLNGWEYEAVASRHEGELVEKVIKIVLSKLRHDFQLDATKHLVGIDGHVNEIRNWVDHTPANFARMIGIYGMGGIGKTTLAKVIYKELSKEFVHRSFLSGIGETTRRNGILYLQNQLIKAIQPNERQVCTIDDGLSLIKSIFKRKKVLIFLDDIDHMNQLNVLARDRDWFMAGSMIIITTRNRAVLDQSEFEVDYMYELNALDEKHSLLLFNKHAFHMDHSVRHFEGISCDIISTMGGHPLGLEIISSYLYGKTNRKVWEDVSKILKKSPHWDIYSMLKMSYDALEYRHKQIFLDIACFLVGKESKFAIYMWNDCGFCASQGIEVLKLRRLIKIGDHGELEMHGQLRDFGRNIVGQEGLPKRRSRLWVYKEAFGVLMREKGKGMIEAICLDNYHDRFETFTSAQFKDLRNLRYLQMKRQVLSGDFNRRFPELRWLQWFELDMSFSATNLHLPNLLVLQLSRSQITEDWRGWSSITGAIRLKVLDLAFCEYLRCNPDLAAFPELEILILKDCFRLEQVHSSIGKVKSLVSLDLSGCSSLKELPGEVGELEELKELFLDSSGITVIPTSISSLRKLEKLSAKCCPSLREIPSSIGSLQNLQHMDISGSAVEQLPSQIGELSSLEILETTDAPISNLPECIQNLSALQHLSIWGCDNLQLPPELPSGLAYLRLCCQGPELPQLACLTHLEELHLSWTRST